MLHNKSNLKQICGCEIFINFLYITSNKLFVILYNKNTINLQEQTAIVTKIFLLFYNYET